MCVAVIRTLLFSVQSPSFLFSSFLHKHMKAFSHSPSLLLSFSLSLSPFSGTSLSIRGLNSEAAVLTREKWRM